MMETKSQIQIHRFSGQQEMLRVSRPQRCALCSQMQRASAEGHSFRVSSAVQHTEYNLTQLAFSIVTICLGSVMS